MYLCGDCCCGIKKTRPKDCFDAMTFDSPPSQLHLVNMWDWDGDDCLPNSNVMSCDDDGNFNGINPNLAHFFVAGSGYALWDNPKEDGSGITGLDFYRSLGMVKCPHIPHPIKVDDIVIPKIAGIYNIFVVMAGRPCTFACESYIAPSGRYNQDVLDDLSAYIERSKRDNIGVSFIWFTDDDPNAQYYNWAFENEICF